MIGSPKQGQWAARTDWYLNFLFAKALVHEPQALSPNFIELLRKLDLAAPDTPHLKESLIVGTGHSQLPCQWVVCVPESSGKTWLKAVRQVAQSLRPSALRIFLPAHVDFDDFQTKCQEIDFKEEFQLEAVIDQALTQVGKV